MSAETTPQLDPSIQAAVDDLEAMIRRRYPMATFAIVRGDDPEGFYLKATVDLADVDEVVDQELLDRLFEFQVEQSLPVYVIPLQPVERVLAEMQTPPAPHRPRLSLPEEPIHTRLGPRVT